MRNCRIEGISDEYEKGKIITGLEKKVSGTKIFHSGSMLSNGKYATNGGRVLGIAATDRGGRVSIAADLAYTRLKGIQFEGIYYRHDIGKSAIEFEKKEKIAK